MDPAPYSVRRAPRRTAVVTMPAQIDFINCGQLYAVLMRAVESGAAVIIADLTRTDFCGYSATVTLVSVHARAARAGSQLRVAAAAPKARLIGQIAGAGHQLDFYPDLTAALAGLRMPGTADGTIATGYRLRLLPGGAARSSPRKPARRLSVVTPASQAPPPDPSPTQRLGRR